MFHPGLGAAPQPSGTLRRTGAAGMVPGVWQRGRAGAWWERTNSVLDGGADKKLFEVKRKDQMNALKNLIELNDINQQYKIIDIMLKGLFKVSHGTGHPLGSVCCGLGEGGQEKQGWPRIFHGVKEKSWVGSEV